MSVVDKFCSGLGERNKAVQRRAVRHTSSRPTTRIGGLLTFLRTKKKQLFQGGDAEAEPAAFTDAQPASSEPSEEEPEDALEDEMDLETLAGIRKAM